MALQLFDGFEFLPQAKNGLNFQSGSLDAAQAGRTGGKSLRFATPGQLAIPLVTPAAVCFMGAAFKEGGGSWGSTSAGAFLFAVWGDAGGTGHLVVNISNDGHLLLRRGVSANGTIIATSLLTVTAAAWHYLEMQVTIADAGGVCIVKVDGVEYINFVGDTKNGGTATTVSTVGLGSMGSCLYDDLYVLDGTGAAPYNTFLGDRVVKRGNPDGAGASTGFVPSAGANWQCVDEDPWTAADYVAAAAAATDLYTHADVAGFSSVDAVQVVTYALKTDAGARTLRTVMRSNIGTSAESADLALPTSIAVVQGPIRQTDPDAAPLTQALINSAQYGVKAV